MEDIVGMVEVEGRGVGLSDAVGEAVLSIMQ